MWGPPGQLYIYVCYGIHQMVNLSTTGEDFGAAVLVRAAEPVGGLDVIRLLLTGPGKVGAALAVDTSWNGHSVCAAGGIEVLVGEPAESVLTGARIGIDYASDEDRTAPLRFAEAGSKWVSHRHKLDLSR